MIGWLRGSVVARGPEGEVLLDVGGVGYRISVPTPLLSAVGEPGSALAVHVHTHVRDDAIVLYGFSTAEDRRCFEALLGAHGVGPSLALAVVSVLGPDELARAVATEDVAALCSVPGVGRKTAARLVIDLRQKLAGAEPTAVPATGSTAAPEPRSEVRAALAELGYEPDEIRRALQVAPDGDEVRDMLRATLRELAAGAVTTRHEVVAATPDHEVVAATADQPEDEVASTRPVDPGPDPADLADEVRLRPRRLVEFLGQPQLTEHLEIVIEAARRRGQPVDHLLFAGPPGLGKTSLAGIVAGEMGVGLRVTSGPALVRSGDLAALLTDLQHGDVLFIDEIHRLPTTVEEVLYPAMEDFQLDIVIGKGPTARSIRLDLPRFTLVGATTRSGLLTGPLRDRFGFVARVDLYEPGDLASIVTRAATILGIGLDDEAAAVIAARARGTPRIANRLLRRVRDYVEVRAQGAVTAPLAVKGLELFGVDALGLDKVDRAILDALCRRFDGRPVGLVTLAQCIGEEPDTVEDAYEPFLLRQGMIQRTPRGRVATPAAFAHLGLPPADAGRTGREDGARALW